MPDTTTLLAAVKQCVSGEVLADEEARHSVSGDFGRLVTRVPSLVVRPSSAEDVVAVIRLADKTGTPVATRGGAHSQSGQSLSDGGILLDLTTLSRTLAVAPDRRTVTCDAGVNWCELVEQLVPQGLIPPVLTNNLNVTVAGTLAMAGLGVASFRYATQGDNCVSLEVVTGTGEVKTCSRAENPDLFFATLAGLGQCAVITRAVLALRPCRPMVRTYFLLYDDLPAAMRDAHQVMTDDRVDYLESWCVPCPQGFRGPAGTRQPFAQWFFPLHLTKEFDAGAPPDDTALLAGLNFYRHVYTDDIATLDFAKRLDALFDLWKRMGYWQSAHPWMETILPWNAAAPYITQVLANLPPTALGGGHILLWPCRGRVSKLPLFRTPGDDFVMGFGILPGVPPELLEQAKVRLNMASELSMMAGGKRYLSGYIAFTRDRWRAHYGERWDEFARAKRTYDPRGVLNPGFIEW